MSAGDPGMQFAAEAALKATVLLAVAMIAIAGTRRWTSAALRHRVLLLALGGALVVPFSCSILRPYQKAIPTPALAAPLAIPANLPLVKTATAPGASLPDSPSPEIAPIADAPRPNVAVVTTPPISWGELLLVAYAIGVVVVLARTITVLFALRRLSALCAPTADAAIDDLATAVCQSFDLRQSVRVVIAKPATGVAVGTPMTWGARRPTIALPTDAGDWPAERLRAALLHEAAHVRREDFLTLAVFARIAVAAYWFHPLVWIAARQLRAESERACDDLVLTAGQMPGADYARHLLEVARMLRVNCTGTGATAAVAMAQTSSIEGRLRAVLSTTLNRYEGGRRSRALLGIAAVAAIGVLSLLRIGAPRAIASIDRAAGANRTGPLVAAVRLPNGATLRVLAVLDRSRDHGDTWWKPDGTRMAHGLVPRDNSIAETPAGSRQRALAIRVEWNAKDQPQVAWGGGRQSMDDLGDTYLFPNTTRPDPNVYPQYLHEPTYGVAPKVSWGNQSSMRDFVTEPHAIDSRRNLMYPVSRRYEMTLDTIGFRNAQKRADITWWIAAGPWTASVDLPKKVGEYEVSSAYGPIHCKLNLDPGPDMNVPCARLDTQINLPRTAKPGHPEVYDGYDVTVVAIDRAGKVLSMLYPQTGGASPPMRYAAVYIPNTLLPKVAGFRLLARPYQAATLRNIELDPKAK